MTAALIMSTLVLVATAVVVIAAVLDRKRQQIKRDRTRIQGAPRSERSTPPALDRSSRPGLAQAAAGPAPPSHHD